MPHDPSHSYYKNCDYVGSPMLVLPFKTLPEGFISRNQVEVQLLDGTWQTLGYQGEHKPCTVRLRCSTGEMASAIERPDQVPAPPLSEDHLPAEVAPRKSDGFVRLEPLPEGWYRVAGVELRREEVLRLLPRLRADWMGVLYSTEAESVYAYWEVNSANGNWCRFKVEQEHLADAEEIGGHHLLSEAGPHTLYRVRYLDPMRPGFLPGLSQQTGFCLGYKRPNGPEMLLSVEPQLLRDYWPVENLYEVLTAEEIVLAKLPEVARKAVEQSY